MPDPAEGVASRGVDASPPPPAPPATAPSVRWHPRPPRPGDLTLGWRAITAATWVGVIIGFASVWSASAQLGLSTWWLGPRADPEPRYIQFAPFVVPVLMLLATINQVRRLAWWGLAASLALAGFGLGDVGRVTSLAIVELAVAGAAAMVSIASLTGTYRSHRSTPGGAAGVVTAPGD